MYGAVDAFSLALKLRHRSASLHCKHAGSILTPDCEQPRDRNPQVLLTNAANYSKGILSEILDFVMGKGMIPADGEVCK